MSVMNQRPEKEVFEEVALLKSMAPSFIEKDWFVTQIIAVLADHHADGFEFVFIDTAAGITGNVLYFNMAAKEIIVVVSPEPTSLTDAYALIKLLYHGRAEKRILLIVNMVKNSHEAREVFTRLSKATEHFLDLSIEYLGYIIYDDKVTEAVKQQRMFMEIYPYEQATKCLASIAKKICREKPEKYNHGSMKFFSRAIVGGDHG